MCTIAVAYRSHPEYPLIIAANRDEFYDRPTAPIDFWEDCPDILAGRDLKGGGTWLGVNRKGKIAALTNFREPGGLYGNGISRGFLVSDFLAKDMEAEAYLKNVAALKNDYGGFNLLAGTADCLFWYSNRGGAITKLTAGIHALSNHLLDTPWPKVETVRRKLSDIIGGPGRIDPEALFDMLADRSHPVDAALPDTGVGKTWERMLSPVFITSSVYGTRCSSVILVDYSGKLIFCERSFDLNAKGDTRCFELQTDKPF